MARNWIAAAAAPNGIELKNTRPQNRTTPAPSCGTSDALTAAELASYPTTTLFVVYCAGPHCNATEKAAIKLARLGRPVKKMIGGVTGWIDEGFELISDV